MPIVNKKYTVSIIIIHNIQFTNNKVQIHN